MVTAQPSTVTTRQGRRQEPRGPSPVMLLQGPFWGAGQSLPRYPTLQIFLDGHRSHALSPAQLMPARPAPAFWPSGPASSLDLRHGLGGAEGGGEQMPTAPCPPLNNRTAEARLAVSPESQG